MDCRFCIWSNFQNSIIIVWNYVSPPRSIVFFSSPIGYIVNMLRLISVITANSVLFLVCLDDEVKDESETGRKKKRQTTPRNVSLQLLLCIFSLLGAKFS